MNATCRLFLTLLAADLAPAEENRWANRRGTGDRANTFIDPEGAIRGPSRFHRLQVMP